MNELEWLKDARPDTPEPDTAAARAALVAHMGVAEAPPHERLAAGHDGRAPAHVGTARDLADSDWREAADAEWRELAAPRDRR
ncbi:hypothetical protein OJ997_30310 [Solirubrobacter phytolaccae]|uniref:Uncharacterized protein n=1 Tax=Solirubrobacter phytolaccae TaxID=1404360 RepID=A0A9X3NEF9_9ACTN|nr:hypothetical protein [Solirubrobacter phytolaccae]MDA0184634.1 hypothetical protein [Solirubrobacter phytolaccae]